MIDPLTGALGRFSFYGVPIGEAEKISEDSVQFTARGVGIYAADLFEFNGFQYLGSWRVPDDVKAEPDPPSYLPIFNFSYRNYRELTGLGRDFVVRSDVALEELRQDGVPITGYSFAVDI
ncbi:MAG: hypothetical protein ICV73_26840 [Acetobacteraceae bacterium]|nr:hypothetical protein [Acetobacteraceae bacterium]